jgi:hypothetical protein
MENKKETNTGAGKVAEGIEDIYYLKVSSEPAFSSRISPDGSMIASSFGDGSIHILSMDYHKELFSFDVQPLNNDPSSYSP